MSSKVKNLVLYKAKLIASTLERPCDGNKVEPTFIPEHNTENAVSI
jgi:hypothetical protein